MASGFFDPVKTPRDAALVIAEAAYNSAYAIPLEIAGINYQAVAAAVLSFGVNGGLLGMASFFSRHAWRQGGRWRLMATLGPGLWLR